jgi:hypothetical protein
MEQSIIKVFEHLERDPRLAGDSPQSIGYYYDLFEKNLGNPLLEEIIDNMSIERRSVTYDLDEIQIIYKTHGGFYERFKGFYNDGLTENNGREPKELINFISSFIEKSLPLADMSYETVRNKLSKNPSFGRKGLLDNALSLCVAGFGGLSTAVLSSAHHENYAALTGTISTIAAINYLKTWIKIIQQDRGWKKLVKEDPTLKNYDAFLATSYAMDEVLPLYKSMRSKNE